MAALPESTLVAHLASLQQRPLAQATRELVDEVAPPGRERADLA